MRRKVGGLGQGTAADRDCCFLLTGRKPFASLHPPGTLRGSVGGRAETLRLPLPAWAPSPVSPPLPKRQLLISAVGASVLCSGVSAFFQLCYFFSVQNMLSPQEVRAKSQGSETQCHPCLRQLGLMERCASSRVPSIAPARQGPEGGLRPSPGPLPSAGGGGVSGRQAGLLKSHKVPALDPEALFSPPLGSSPA